MSKKSDSSDITTPTTTYKHLKQKYRKAKRYFENATLELQSFLIGKPLPKEVGIYQHNPSSGKIIYYIAKKGFSPIADTNCVWVASGGTLLMQLNNGAVVEPVLQSTESWLLEMKLYERGVPKDIFKGVKL